MEHTTEILQLGRRLRRFSLFLIILSPCALVLLLIWKGPLSLVEVPRNINLIHEPLGMWGAFAVTVVGSMRPLVFFIALLLVHRLFGLFAQGVVFAPQAVLLIRRLGMALIAADIVAMLQSALTGPLLTLLDLTPRHMAIPIQTSMLVVGFFIVLIGHVLKLACEVYERDRLTI
jgi:hypothetical protein